MKVVLMHGKDTSPEEKWYPWLINEIRKREIEIFAPELPKSKDPVLDEWLKELNKINPDENTVLIGHSRGGVAILRWLERLPKEKKTKKVILVSTNSGDSEKVNKTENNKDFFTKEGYDFEKIKSHCNNFVVIHSKDDHIVPYQAGVENTKGLGAKFLSFENKRHFGKGHDGKIQREFPELLKEVLKTK